MEAKVLKALEESKRRLEQINAELRPGSLGRAKNDHVLSLINEVLPEEAVSIKPENYQSDLVYPDRQ